jgi:hypothetical protein
MKESPQQQDQNRLFKASKFSAEGFLGEDGRPIEEIIADDMRALEATGVSKEELVTALTNAFMKAKDAYGAPADILPGITAAYFESRGRIPSPFRGDGIYEKGEAQIQRQSNGESLIITPLGIAMVAKHGFFQGKGSRYRIDPEKTVRLLGLNDT